jgi:predicted enzyme related to lactoylglutathione lyase
MSVGLNPGAVLYAKDLSRVSAFYVQVLGLKLVRETEDFVVLTSGNFRLTVVEIPAHIARDIHLTTPPARREDTPIKMVFNIESLQAARAKMAEQGGELNPPEREWKDDGALVCDGHDPEGNVLQLRQSAVEPD